MRLLVQASVLYINQFYAKKDIRVTRYMRMIRVQNNHQKKAE